MVYLMYGVNFNVTGLRDKFIAAAPIYARDSNNVWDQFLTFTLCLNVDGSAQVFVRDRVTCNYKCLLYVDNIGIPPKDPRFIKALYSKSYATTPTSTPIFISEPVQMTTYSVCIGNFKYFELMDTKSDLLPLTTLFNVDPTIDFSDQVFRYQCECDSNTLLPADSLLTLPDGGTTSQLNYGQGAALKMYNLTACSY